MRSKETSLSWLFIGMLSFALLFSGLGLYVAIQQIKANATRQDVLRSRVSDLERSNKTLQDNYRKIGKTPPTSTTPGPGQVTVIVVPSTRTVTPLPASGSRSRPASSPSPRPTPTPSPTPSPSKTCVLERVCL